MKRPSRGFFPGSPDLAVAILSPNNTVEKIHIRRFLAPHETYKKLLGRLIKTATEELDLEIRSLGSRTGDREDLARGLEPAQCHSSNSPAAVVVRRNPEPSQ